MDQQPGTPPTGAEQTQGVAEAGAPVEGKDWIRTSSRQIHLDFHTPGWVKAGERFDAVRFAQTVADAGADTIVLCAKDHYGHSYFHTTAGKRHPQLDRDLLGEQLAALKQHDIRVFAYYDVACDRLAAEEHPEWRQVTGAGEAINVGKVPLVCLRSGFTAERVVPQVRELLTQYPALDGLWFDAVMMDPAGCHCPACSAAGATVAAAQPGNGSAEGIQALIPQEEALTPNDQAAQGFIQQISDLVHELAPDCVVTFNNQAEASRKARFAAERMDVIEVEALPASKGYYYLPFHIRYARDMGKPVKGLTARFQNWWGDFGTLKGAEQLQFECASALTGGGTCSIGDQMPASGELDADVYSTLTEVFDFVKAREQWVSGSQSVSPAAILVAVDGNNMDACYGAAKLLMENHVQFDVIDAKASLTPYQLVVIPDEANLPPAAQNHVMQFMTEGGRVLACKLPMTEMTTLLPGAMGMAVATPADVPMGYIKVTDETIAVGIPAMPVAVPGGFQELAVAMAGEAVADWIPPLEAPEGEGYGHAQAPPAATAKGPIGVKSSMGDGRSYYFGAGLFATYYTQGFAVIGKILMNALDDLLPPAERLVQAALPSTVEVAVFRQNERAVIHLLNYHALRRGDHYDQVGEFPTLTDITMSVTFPKPPKRVYVVPGEKVMMWKRRDDRIEFTVPQLKIHTMVVLEGVYA